MSTKVHSASTAAPKAKASAKKAKPAESTGTKKAPTTKKAKSAKKAKPADGEGKTDKNRVFYLLGETVEPAVDTSLLPDNGGKYKGKPMQAAKKAFNAITRRCAEKDTDVEYIFTIQEFTPGSKMSRFTYRGTRSKRAEPHKIVKAGKAYEVRYDTDVKAYKPAGSAGTKKAGTKKRATKKKASTKKAAPKKVEPEETIEEEGEESNGVAEEEVEEVNGEEGAEEEGVDQ